jgi:probable H4MPT-linked C1 transfer pathway protein
MSPPDAPVIGWDVGGAHVKASLIVEGAVCHVVQWACPLWQGIDFLDAVLSQARMRWPQMRDAAHAVTMTGEMADVFDDREQGVLQIAQRMAGLPGTAMRFYAAERGWCDAHAVARHWADIASANWHATARLAARRVGDAVLVDIGSTTTDLVPLRGGVVGAEGRGDAARLALGELVYQGVVRTPLCALGSDIMFRGRPIAVMNEFFATTADVYRLTGELDPAHDLHESADHGAKDLAGSRRRLARMIGMDARDAAPQEWLQLARAWRTRQLSAIAGQLERVRADSGAPPARLLVSAGCGDFLVAELGALFDLPARRFAGAVLPTEGADTTLARAVQVCAPAVAVALLYLKDGR